MARVLLVTAHSLFRQALAHVLADRPDFVVVGQAGSLAEARGLLAAVDIALIDDTLPDGPGRALIPALHRASPGGAALILTARPDRATVARAIEVGAAGVLPNSASLDEVIAALRRLGAGQSLLSPQEQLALLRLAIALREEEREARDAAARLTPREREVLRALARGQDDEAMATTLHISPRTARTHVANILGKLGAESRVQALVFAVRHHLAAIG